MKIELTLNGEPVRREVPPWRTLLELLRDDLGLTGTKGYCYSGICGACTVLVNGGAVSSCIMLAVQVQAKDVTTVEDLEVGGELHPVQRAFIDHLGFQCGYCTPGMLLLAKALLDENPHPTEEQVREYMGGNICRCTGYGGILDSVMAAAEALERERSGSGTPERHEGP